MNSAILVVDSANPAAHASRTSEYHQVKGRTAAQFQDVMQLGADVWLIPLHSSLPFLAAIASVAGYAGLPYKVTFLDKEPVWLSFDNDGKPVTAS